MALAESCAGALCGATCAGEVTN